MAATLLAVVLGLAPSARLMMTMAWIVLHDVPLRTKRISKLGAWVDLGAALKPSPRQPES